jgi:Uncharacterized protein conserved in bacteria (DUF2147)
VVVAAVAVIPFHHPFCPFWLQCALYRGSVNKPLCNNKSKMTFLKLRAGLSLIVFFFSVAAFSQSGTITGNWQAEDKSKNMQMEIYLAKDGNYYGKIINDNSKASKNGTLVLQNLIYDGKKQQYTGTIKPPDAGLTLHATVTLENTNRIKIEANKIVMCKTMYLIRIK